MNDEIKFVFEDMCFTWDDDKAILNWKKHKVTFETAAEVFIDEYAVDIWDMDHNDYEDRRNIIGRVDNSDILFVVYVERTTQYDEVIYRIISARPANRKERKLYEHGISR